MKSSDIIHTMAHCRSSPYRHCEYCGQTVRMRRTMTPKKLDKHIALDLYNMGTIDTEVAKECSVS